ncbi:MAG: class I SAM-dependent methyltransferase [Rhodospirillaceae bacterium]|nr:class I SAM-dependent methyltransferase [Rhodospirillaceae bacterium]
MRRPVKTTTNKIDSTTVSEEAAAGAAVYSNLLLSIYDLEVLMFELQYIFKCPLKKEMDFFNENVSGTHLDVGVGTGYFLDKCNFPVAKPTVHLIDLNANTLRKTSKRIRRYKPAQYQCNVMEPIQADLPLFESISAINFLHCLPGTMLEKEIVIRNLKPFLQDGGVFFGATVLGQGVDVGILYRHANTIYNKKSIFSNLSDNITDLEIILKNNFNEYSLETVGSVAFFSGHD